MGGGRRDVLEVSSDPTIKDLAKVFLKLGFTGFGGPAVHIAMMEEELVRRRAWLTRDEFLDLVSASNLIPGPNSTELALHVGLCRAGWKGFATAGACFILPAMAIVMAMAWAYVNFGQLPGIQGLLTGVKPVILAILGCAVWNLLKGWRRQPRFLILTLTCVILSSLGIAEVPILIASGLMALIGSEFGRHDAKNWVLICVMVTANCLALTTHASPFATPEGSVPYNDSRLFLFFLKVGSVLYGTGYALIAFLDGDLVQRYGWINSTQLVDAIAVGQFTPGPVFTTATFVGYLLSGPRGAILATVGIFLPAFVFVFFSQPLLKRLKSLPRFRHFLDGLNCASLGLLIAATFKLIPVAVTDFTTASLALACALILLVFRVNSAWLILIGALLGLGVRNA